MGAGGVWENDMRAWILWVLCVPVAAATASDYDDLIAAERGFAAQAQAQGVREAFIANFSDDNIGYGPGPVMGREKWRARPAATFKLEWAPSAGEIAAAGDFGYTYGPWQLRALDAAADAAPAAGHFFSIWERDADGRFVNVFDHGISHPAVVALDGAVMRRGLKDDGPRAARVSSRVLNTRMQMLVTADRALASALATDQGATARAAVLTEDVAWLRSGAVPAYGREAAPVEAPFTSDQLVTMRLAGSGDLGFTSGWSGDADKPLVYARVWRYAASGWRLVVDYLETAPR
jgi:ketosteroid isomerase-like protein